VPLTGGTFAGPELTGKLLPGSSADWQIVLPDGTALGDTRYTLQTDDGDLLYVQSRSARHGSADVLARLANGEDVDATRIRLPHLNPDRDRRTRARLAEQERLHRRRRPAAQWRDLRNLPGRMTAIRKENKMAPIVSRGFRGRAPRPSIPRVSHPASI
jgi:Protein of unknown function (DUF3237)